jgi:hypothetical protein
VAALKELSIPCRINVGGKWSSGCIHDVSDHGLLLSSIAPPPIGTYVDIRRGTLIIIGRVIWVGGNRFGVRMQDPVGLATLLSEPVLERRSETRDATVRRTAEQADRNRRWSSTFQFACLVIIGLGAACFAAMQCYTLLSKPLVAVTGLLARSAA